VRGLEPLRSLGLLLAQLPRSPREFGDRVAGYADFGLQRLFGDPPAYETVSWRSVLGDLEASLGDVAGILGEPALAETEENTRWLLENIRGRDSFSPRWAADSRLARLCYLLCRLSSPSVVVETGA
jgi:hypothetical protein